MSAQPAMAISFIGLAILLIVGVIVLAAIAGVGIMLFGKKKDS